MISANYSYIRRVMDLSLHIYFQSQQCNAFNLHVIFVVTFFYYISRNLSVMIIKLIEHVVIPCKHTFYYQINTIDCKN